jgi:hypothetical protein
MDIAAALELREEGTNDRAFVEERASCRNAVMMSVFDGCMSLFLLGGLMADGASLHLMAADTYLDDIEKVECIH